MWIELNGKNINIPDERLELYQEKLGLTENDAVALYLEEERLYRKSRANYIRR